MTEQEVSVRLTENDERLYACAKRLEAVERRQDALDKLVTAVEVLAVRQESVEGNVKETLWTRAQKADRETGC